MAVVNLANVTLGVPARGGQGSKFDAAGRGALGMPKGSGRGWQIDPPAMDATKDFGKNLGAARNALKNYQKKLKGGDSQWDGIDKMAVRYDERKANIYFVWAE